MEPKKRHHIMSLKEIKGQLTAAVQYSLRSLYRYEPLWLGDIDAENKAYHDLKRIGDRGCKFDHTTSTAHSTREAMSLVCFFDRVRRSRHGWMMVLHARCGGMDVRRLAFLKLYMFLSDEKREQFAQIVYQMTKERFCRFKKLMIKLPGTKAEPFADILEHVTHCQFDLYIKVLSTTDLPWKGKKHEDGGPDAFDRSVTKQISMPQELEDTGDEWRTLQQHIISLPGELRDMIKDSLWDIAFRPGQIFPHRPQAFDSMEGKAYEAPVTRLFLAMDKALYEWMRIRFWSENTWVIGYGDAESTMRFLNHVPTATTTGNDLSNIELPNAHLPSVRLHLELRFSSKDLPGAADHCHEISSADLKRHSLYRDPDILDFLHAYRWNITRVADRLDYLWLQKFLRVSELDNLEELTLDFTEAFAPDNEFIGTNSARDWPAFFHGLPPVLDIRAPTDELTQELYEIFDDNQPGDLVI